MKQKTKTKKPHRVLWVVLILLFVLVAAVVALGLWQRENIAAVIKAQNATSEDIAAEIATSKATTQKEIEKYNIPITRDFTLEEEEEIRKGTLTVEEAVQRLMSSGADVGAVENAEANAAAGPQGQAQAQAQGQAQSPQGSAQGQPQATKPAGGSQANTSLTREQQIVAKYLTEMYSLKAYYIGQLGQLEATLKAEYKQSFGNNKNPASIAKFVQSNMSRAVKMESQCDSRVYQILGNMRSELTAIGADTTIVQVAEDAYINEKSLRKSYYLSLYK